MNIYSIRTDSSFKIFTTVGKVELGPTFSSDLDVSVSETFKTDVKS